MGLLQKARDAVSAPIAKAAVDILKAEASANLAKGTAPATLGPPIRRTTYDANMTDSGLRTKPGSSVSFETLRRFSRNHEISRICINTRKRQISSLDWDIVPEDPEDKTDYTDDIKLLKAYFKNLGGYRMRFRELQDTLVEDLLVLDAVVMYKQRNRAGNILYYMPVDGSTIKLRVDQMGNTPLPPEIAYRQVIRGTVTGEFTADQMIYEMMNPRTDTPYGLAPLESLILVAMSSLKGTQYNLGYLTEGNVPEGFLKLPENWSQKQITEFMDYFDALMSGDVKQMTKVKAIQGDYTPTKKRDDMAFKDFNMWLMKVTCAMFDIQPQEIGFTETVNKSTGKEQNDIATRRGILPLANLLTEIWNDIIQEDLGYPQLRFKYLGLEDRDMLLEAQTKQIHLQSGIQSVDEVRKEMGLDPIGIDTPYVIGQPTFLTDSVVLAADEQNTTDSNKIDASQAHGTATEESGDSNLIPEKSVSAEDELKKFKTYAVKRIKDGKSLRKFESSVLNEYVINDINKRLTGCTDPNRAKTIIDTYRSNPRFLAKAGDAGNQSKDYPPNPHFEALLASAGFIKFEKAFATAIKAQADWTADQLKSLEDNLLAGETELSTTQIAEFEAYLYDNMPAIASLVDESLVNAWLVEVVNRGVNSLYDSIGADLSFNLTDESYLNALKEQATNLLTKSTLDNTTRNQLTDLLIKDRASKMTVTEISKDIADKFKNISSVRANMIARTETVNLLNESQYKVMQRAGVTMKEWINYGPDPCQICLDNAGDGPIPMDAFFSSGDLMPSAHTRCECGEDFLIGEAELANLWDGSDS